MSAGIFVVALLFLPSVFLSSRSIVFLKGDVFVIAPPISVALSFRWYAQVFLSSTSVFVVIVVTVVVAFGVGNGFRVGGGEIG